MNKLLLFLLLNSLSLFSQVKLTKDSFLLQGKPFPENYKELIANGTWKLAAAYNMNTHKITFYDSSIPGRMVFEEGSSYSRIRGNKIISMYDTYAKGQIIFVSAFILLLEYKHKEKGVKKRNRYYYRHQD